MASSGMSMGTGAGTPQGQPPKMPNPAMGGQMGMPGMNALAQMFGQPALQAPMGGGMAPRPQQQLQQPTAAQVPRVAPPPSYVRQPVAAAPALPAKLSASEGFRKFVQKQVNPGVFEMNNRARR